MASRGGVSCSFLIDRANPVTIQNLVVQGNSIRAQAHHGSSS